MTEHRQECLWYNKALPLAAAFPRFSTISAVFLSAARKDLRIGEQNFPQFWANIRWRSRRADSLGVMLPDDDGRAERWWRPVFEGTDIRPYTAHARKSVQIQAVGIHPVQQNPGIATG